MRTSPSRLAGGNFFLQCAFLRAQPLQVRDLSLQNVSVHTDTSGPDILRQQLTVYEHVERQHNQQHYYYLLLPTTQGANYKKILRLS